MTKPKHEGKVAAAFLILAVLVAYLILGFSPGWLLDVNGLADTTENGYITVTVYTLDKHEFGWNDLQVWAWYWPVTPYPHQVYLNVTYSVFQSVPMFQVCRFGRWAEEPRWSSFQCWDPEHRVFLPILTVK